MKGSIIAVSAVSGLLSTSYAATVTIKTTHCQDSNVELKQVEVEVGGSAATPVVGLEAVCGLEIIDASGVDAYDVQCQAFRDSKGIQIGSALFTVDQPAQIGTNPIVEKAILCTTNLERRQEKRSSSVHIKTTACLDPSIKPVELDVTIGSTAPMPVDLASVCGLQILSATPDIDVNTVQCQAFRDAQGTQVGSALFTYANPASIATNPVVEKGILCTTNLKGGAGANNTSSVSAPAPAPASSGSPSTLATMPSSLSSAAPASGNSTTPSKTGAPTMTQILSATSTGAAGTVAISAGMLAAAFAATFL